MSIAIDDFPKSIFESKKSDINHVVVVVNAGDNLSGIASKYNVSIIDIAIANKLEDIDNLNAGQILVIPHDVTENEKNLYLAEYQGIIYDAQVNIKNMELYLENLNNKTKKIQNDINEMAMKLKSQNYAVPIDTINEYKGKIKTYNDKVTEYKSEYKKYASRLYEFNKLVKQYKSIAGSNNK